MGTIPAADIPEDIGIVRRLLGNQASALGRLDGSLELVANGWDNFIYRWEAVPGRYLAVRVPRRHLAVELTLAEQRWLPEISERLSTPIPVPLLAGVPSEEFPYPWSVTVWFEGEEAMGRTARENAALLTPLAEFLTQLHRPAPPEAPVNTARNDFVGSTARTQALRSWLDAGHIPSDVAPTEDVWNLWAILAATPAYPRAPSWVHGDLHSGNMLVHGGELVAVVDFGDLTAGDPAVDLAIMFELFEAPERAAFRAEVLARAAQEPDASGMDEHVWDRARAWALYFAAISFSYGAPGEAFYERGIFGLHQVLEG